MFTASANSLRTLSRSSSAMRPKWPRDATVQSSRKAVLLGRHVELATLRLVQAGLVAGDDVVEVLGVEIGFSARRSIRGGGVFIARPAARSRRQGKRRKGRHLQERTHVKAC